MLQVPGDGARAQLATVLRALRLVAIDVAAQDRCLFCTASCNTWCISC